MSTHRPAAQARGWPVGLQGMRVAAPATALLLLAAFVGRLVATSDDYRVTVVLVTLLALGALTPLFLHRAEALLVVFAGSIAIGALGRLLPGTTMLPLLGAWLGLVWGIRFAVYQRLLVWVPEFTWLFLYGALVVVASLAGLDPSNSLRPLLSTIQLIILSFLVVQILRKPRWAFAVGWALIGSLSALAVVLLGTRLLEWRGYGLDWRVLESYTRVGGIYGDVNTTASVLVVGALFTTAYLGHYRRGGIRTLLLACLVLQVGAALQTGSMTGVLALVVGLGLLLSRVYESVRVKTLLKLVVGMGIVAALLYLSVPVVEQRVQEKYAEITTRDAAYWGTQRVATWEGAIGVIREHPVLGVGVANGEYLIPQFWSLWRVENVGPHNMFLGIALDAGIPAALAFIVFAFYATWGLYRVVHKARPGDGSSLDQRRLHTAAVATLVSLVTLLLVVGMALEISRLHYLWLLLGLAIAIRLQAGRAMEART